MAYVFCTIYSFFLLYMFVGQYQKNNQLLTIRANKFIFIFPALYWLLLLGSQYYVGSDYPTYYTYFEGANLQLYASRHEYALVFICALIHALHLPAQSGFFIYSFVDILFFCLFIFKFNFERKDLFLLIYFCVATAFINQQNALRQYAAMNIFLLAFYYCYKKEFIKYLLFILLASTFHLSAILLIVIYPLRLLFCRYSKKILYIELLFGVIFCFYGLDSVITWFVKFTPYAFYLTSSYFLEDNRKGIVNILTKIIYLLFFVQAIRFSKTYSVKEKFLLSSGVFFYSVKLISMSSYFLSRFSMYFDVASYFPLYLYFAHLVKEKRKYEYLHIFELFIFLCVVIGTYLVKTLFVPSKEYIYQSIFFK